MKNLLKIVLLLLALLTVIFLPPSARAVPENNPPICDHAWSAPYPVTGICHEPGWHIPSENINVKSDTPIEIARATSYENVWTFNEKICSKCGAKTSDLNFMALGHWISTPNNGVSISSLEQDRVITASFSDEGNYILTTLWGSDSGRQINVHVFYDDDDDGLSNSDELTIYNTDPNDSDSDDDGLSDGDEVLLYHTDPNNNDSDNDGLSDRDEVLIHNTNPNDSDSDADGIPDIVEIEAGLNPNNPGDASDDKDNDGLSNLEEYNLGTNPARPDTDGDGINDTNEITNGLNPNDASDAVLDNDNDGISNRDEITHGLNLNDASDAVLDNDNDGISNRDEITHGLNPNDASDAVLDNDNDGISNRDEINVHHTNPNKPDSDGDGINDTNEITNGLNPNDASDAVLDNDNDGISNCDEITHGLNLNDASDAVLDNDNDGISNRDEINVHHTNPNKPDSDGDGINDTNEITNGLNPNDASDAVLDNDNDEISNRDEITHGLNLNDASDAVLDNDNDGISNRDEITHGLNPNDPNDTDADYDNDGLCNRDEIMVYKTNYKSHDNIDLDIDGDGLSTREEIFVYKTNPYNADTDGDVLPDGIEISYGLDPLKPSIYDKFILNNNVNDAFPITEERINCYAKCIELSFDVNSNLSFIQAEILAQRFPGDYYRDFLANYYSIIHRPNYVYNQQYQMMKSYLNECESEIISKLTGSKNLLFFLRDIGNRLTSYISMQDIFEQNRLNEIFISFFERLSSELSARYIYGGSDPNGTYPAYFGRPDLVYIQLLNCIAASQRQKDIRASISPFLDPLINQYIDINPQTNPSVFQIDSTLNIISFKVMSSSSFIIKILCDTSIGVKTITISQPATTWKTFVLDLKQIVRESLPGVSYQRLISLEFEGNASLCDIIIKGISLLTDGEDNDGDGVSDWDEIYKYFTDRHVIDSDGDGISDGDEVMFGMDPLSPAPQGNGYKYQEIIHDDAEGGNVEKWIVPASVSFNNIIDPENSNNRVFSCSGNLVEGVVFNFSELTNPSVKLSWRMKANGSFRIEVGCQTTNGSVRFIFTEADTDALEQEPGVYYIGLGHATANNIWFTVICDLQRELWKIDPNNKILQIDYFGFSGNGLLDDLKSLMYVDSDRDCIPDSVEISLGLNPNDHLDAKLDMDGDGLTNAEEFMNKTAINNPDTDGDGVIDYDELTVFRSNPNSVDTDNDGLDDLWELTISGNMILTPDGDRNNDGITNLEECNLKLQINKTQELNGNIHLLIY